MAVEEADEGLPSDAHTDQPVAYTLSKLLGGLPRTGRPANGMSSPLGRFFEARVDFETRTVGAGRWGCLDGRAGKIAQADGGWHVRGMIGG